MEEPPFRADLPGVEGGAYFNTGASGPTHVSAVEAATAYLERQGYEAPTGEGPYGHAFERYESAREAIAGAFGAAPDEVALTGSTTDGINRVAGAIDFRPGDTVVRTDREHNAGVLPWDRLRDTRGITVETVPVVGGTPDWERFETVVEDARLVVASAVGWGYGHRLPVQELVERAHDAGTRVLVDAVQAVGQEPVDFRAWGADFVAAAGHKWLLAPWGAGMLYVRDGVESWCTPERIGYRGVREPDDRAYRFEPGARRFEIGSASPAPHVGLAAVLEEFETVGLEAVRERIGALTDRLKGTLDERRVLGPQAFESGLVTVGVADPEAAVERLAERDIYLRTIPGIDAVRASVHAFNTEREIDRLAAALAEIEPAGE